MGCIGGSMKRGGYRREEEMAMRAGASTGGRCRRQEAERGRGGGDRGRCQALHQPLRAPGPPNKDSCLNLSFLALLKVHLSGEGWRV